jgi:hypothetical protein
MSLSDVFSVNQAFIHLRDLLIFFEGKVLHNLKSSKKTLKAHTYVLPLKNGNTFALEPVSGDALKFCMTGFGAGLKRGEFIIINDRHSIKTFKIEAIDYYLDPPDLWTASLVKCSY